MVLISPSAGVRSLTLIFEGSRLGNPFEYTFPTVHEATKNAININVDDLG